MILKAFGCSFIHGTDLADVGELTENRFRPSQSTWPALIAKQLGLGYNCVAKGGSGNLQILDNVLSSAEMDRNQRDMYIVAWSWSSRFDYSNPHGRHFDGSQRHAWCTLHPPSTLNNKNDVETFYFRNLHSEYRDKLTTLLYINSAIELLQSRNLPFLMTCMDEMIFDTKWHTTPGITCLQDRAKAHVRDFQGQNFLHWATQQGFSVSDTGHPLEAAHAVAADLMLPEVQSLVNTMNKRD
jgi:hypothetical protein